MSKNYIGTSGFNYKHWSNAVFYPKGLHQSKWLSYYSETFNSVELNVSFYRLPKKSTFEKWAKETPRDFCFAAKGSRYITHIKRLIDPQDSIKMFFENASGLSSKLEIVLWQLGANFKADKEKLENFCGLLKKNKNSRDIRQSFEFRHKTWFSDEIYKVLEKYNFSLCIAHSKEWPQEEVATADYVYLRFHGGDVLYSSNYTDRELKDWAKKVRKWVREGRDIYAYFNNDAMGYAPKNALTFRDLVSFRKAL